MTVEELTVYWMKGVAVWEKAENNETFKDITRKMAKDRKEQLLRCSADLNLLKL